MVHMRREVRSWMDYIIDTDCHLFGNISIQDPWKKLDHYLILGFPKGATLTEHSHYLGKRTRTPLHSLDTPAREDQIFVELRKAVPKQKAWEARGNTWILEATCRLIYTRVSVLQGTARNH